MKRLLHPRAMVRCALFAALIAVGAFIRIPNPVIGIPITLQFMMTNLAALLLGAPLGALSVGLYILLGLTGLPIFTGGGGIGYVLQPTFGYIIGFAVGAWWAGKIVESTPHPTLRTFWRASLVNLLVVDTLGVFYFYAITRIYVAHPPAFSTIFLSGFLLCLPGDLLCTALSLPWSMRLRRILSRNYPSIR